MPKYAKSNALLIVGGGVLTATTILGTAIAALWFKDDLEDKGIPLWFGLAVGIALAMCCIAWGFTRENRRLRDNLDDQKLIREWREMLMRHSDILTEIKDRSPEEISDLEDWRNEATVAVNKAAEDIREAMGASYATRFMRTGTWIGEPASGNVNKAHRSYRAHLEQYIKNLIAIFDELGH
ncbi:MAG: hypothetical protein V3T84_11010 [Phycisphaerales bacterium]